MIALWQKRNMDFMANFAVSPNNKKYAFLLFSPRVDVNLGLSLIATDSSFDSPMGNLRNPFGSSLLCF